ncbi:uncharacterized protein LOC116928104 [Daphnia magna]|uniref:Uncharacterized protein n=1 Tax=Daphnia magna TaxID=35525 RepID=A0ABR0AK95_9CRUS|nr:uncharacterized protein LOC116928104 [Daphnia magna]KAK4025545.1 hypothetical protein OUZ56_014609 [Daphnia magna]
MILPVALICAITAATSTSMDALPAQTQLGQSDSGSLNFSEARMLWSNCRGKRLDTLTLYKHTTPRECVEMGGDCCAINADGIGNGSDDPRTMSSDKCYGCYNSTIKVKCTGKLVRSQSGFFQDWWVNSKNCIKAGGFCCDGTKTSDNPAIFDPNDYPNADFCLNCYAGPVQNTTEMDGIWEKVVTSCSGQMIANNDYKASTCTRFGGSCCDDDTSTNSNFGGNAFSASTFPDSRCNSCFTGEPKEIGELLQ